jgi:superfamily I DNA/RNA helicase
VPLEHILVIHADWQGAARMLDRLRAELGEERAANPRQPVSGSHVRVCGLDAVTGLESPIVFLLGTHRLIEAEESLRLSEEERTERRRDNTRRLYMAMTRAGQRLVLTYVGAAPPAELHGEG